MSLETGRYQLFSALNSLQQSWRDTIVKWNDGVRRDFEENVWDPLEHDTKSALAAIDQLDQVLHQIKRECSDE